MPTIAVEIPATLGEREARMLFAAKLVEVGVVSSGKGAEMAGVSKEEFLLFLSDQGQDVIDSSIGDLGVFEP